MGYGNLENNWLTIATMHADQAACYTTKRQTTACPEQGHCNARNLAGDEQRARANTVRRGHQKKGRWALAQPPAVHYNAYVQHGPRPKRRQHA